jgi:TonB-linked SusC/RagA family outer membrane protein
MRKFLLMTGGLLCLLVTATFGQTKQVTGSVTDISGSPIPNASIRIKGTKTGTSADASGNFTIMASPSTVLIISGIGFETREVTVGNLTKVTVQLPQDNRSLNEVVVTGVGTATTKKKLGIAVQSVSASQLPATPTASIDQALVGKVPGAQISTISGNPGDPVNIVLRGINTVQRGTKPLIMMDGVEVPGDLTSLDLSSVERVEVVEGAAAATLYGAQGANGVIQLFTKKGRAGKVSLNFSSSYAGNSYINSGNFHKSALHPYLTDASNNIVDYATGQPLQFTPDGLLKGISYANATSLPSGEKHSANSRYGILSPLNINDKPYNANLKYYDHFKEVFQSGYTFNNSINVSGGSDRNDFFVNVSNNHSLSPILQNGYFDRTNLTANLGFEIAKGLRLRSNTQLIYTKNTMTPGLGAQGGVRGYYGTGEWQGNVSTVYGFLNTSPFFDLKYKDADGNYPVYQYADFLSVNATNPYYVKQYASGLDNKVEALQTFDLNYKANRFLELDAKYGLTYKTENARWTYQNQSTNLNAVNTQNWIDYNNGNDNLGEISNFQYNTTFQNFLASGYFRFDAQKDFHSRLPIQSSTQVAFDYRKRKYTEYDSYGLGVPLVPPINMTTVGDPNLTSSFGVNQDYTEPFITYGYLLNEKLDYGEYGGITAGLRSDFSSAFGQGHTPFTFPHGDAYVLPSSFNFWDKLSDAIPYFKIRGSYGEAGIQPNPFDRYPTLTPGQLGASSVYSIPVTSQNPNLKVEVSKELEVGTDFSINLFKGGSWLNSINAGVTYWKRTSENVIYTVSVPPSTGSTGQLTNAIDMHSNGVEFQVTIPVYKSRIISWDLTSNFGHQVSFVDKIQGGADIVLTSAAGSTSEVLREGTKIGQIYGYKALTSLGQKMLDGKTPYIDPSQYGNYEMVNGRVVETASRAIQFTAETYAIGDPNPKFNMSFINSFNYKGYLTFAFQFDWLYGTHLYNQTKEWMYRDGIAGDFEKKVNIGGNNAAYTAYWASAYYALGAGSTFSSHGPGNNSTKDYFWEDASFVRLRNVQLAFDFARAFRIKGLNRVQLVLTGRNLLTFTKYSGADPEISSGSANSSFDRGVDHSTIPNLKAYQVGLNVGL